MPALGKDRRSRDRHDAAPPSRCPRCGYDLRGLADRPCPECGVTSTAEQRALASDLAPFPWPALARAAGVSAGLFMLAGPVWIPLAVLGVVGYDFVLLNGPYWMPFAVLGALVAVWPVLVWFTHAPGPGVHVRLAVQGLWRTPAAAVLGPCAVAPLLVVRLLGLPSAATSGFAASTIVAAYIGTVAAVAGVLYVCFASPWFRRWSGAARSLGWVQPAAGSAARLVALALMCLHVAVGAVLTIVLLDV